MTVATEIDADELRDAVRGLLADVTIGTESGPSEWQATLDAGWLALGVSAERGGLGQSMLTVAMLLEEVGRQPCGVPLLEATVAASMLDAASRAGSRTAPELLAGTLAGKAGVVCAGMDAQRLRVTDASAMVDIGSWPQAARATHLLVPATCDRRGEVLLIIPCMGDAVSIEALQGWDPTRCYGRVRIRGPFAAFESLTTEPAATSALLAHGRTVLDLAMSSDSLGGAAQLLDVTVGYLKQREQFGRPIGSFQALKHRCADLVTEIAAARAALLRACRSHDASEPDAGLLAALARASAGAVYGLVAEECIQLHGGIGFTFEHVCHHYLRRARAAETIGGTRAARLDAVAEALLRELGTTL
jgi:alkylation response protein AidB-like acyl-CoA dehydrogenase